MRPTSSAGECRVIMHAWRCNYTQSMRPTSSDGEFRVIMHVWRCHSRRWAAVASGAAAELRKVSDLERQMEIELKEIGNGSGDEIAPRSDRDQIEIRWRSDRE